MINYSNIQITIEIFGAFVCIVCASAAFVGRKVDAGRSRLLYSMLSLEAVLLVSDVFAIYYDGWTTMLGLVSTRIGNFVVFAAPPILCLYAIAYLYNLIEDKASRPNIHWLYLATGICGLDVLYVVLSQFFGWIYYLDENNVYHRSPGFVVTVVLGAMLLILCMALTLAYRRQLTQSQFLSHLLLCLLPFLTNIIQYFYYGLSLNNFASCLAMFFLFSNYHVEGATYILVQRERLLQKELNLSNQRLQLSQKDKELTEKRIQISLSQLQPHFVFNVLGSIEQLCLSDPNQAAEATNHFASYLRSNLNALNRVELVPFSEELQHIRTYVWLEKMRFGEELDYREDIAIDNFGIPVLAVQPLIENAIKHGMKNTEDVLTVTLQTREEEDCYLIIISDNGGGFEVSKPTNEKRSHIGLTNVQERVRLMSHGTLLIDSRLREGTTVTIRIPKNEHIL